MAWELREEALLYVKHALKAPIPEESLTRTPEACKSRLRAVKKYFPVPVCSRREISSCGDDIQVTRHFGIKLDSAKKLSHISKFWDVVEENTPASYCLVHGRTTCPGPCLSERGGDIYRGYEQFLQDSSFHEWSYVGGVGLQLQPTKISGQGGLQQQGGEWCHQQQEEESTLQQRWKERETSFHHEHLTTKLFGVGFKRISPVFGTTSTSKRITTDGASGMALRWRSVHQSPPLECVTNSGTGPQGASSIPESMVGIEDGTGREKMDSVMEDSAAEKTGDGSSGRQMLENVAVPDQAGNPDLPVEAVEEDKASVLKDPALNTIGKLELEVTEQTVRVEASKLKLQNAEEALAKRQEEVSELQGKLKTLGEEKAKKLQEMARIRDAENVIFQRNQKLFTQALVTAKKLASGPWWESFIQDEETVSEIADPEIGEMVNNINEEKKRKWDDYCSGRLTALQSATEDVETLQGSLQDTRAKVEEAQRDVSQAKTSFDEASSRLREKAAVANLIMGKLSAILRSSNV